MPGILARGPVEQQSYCHQERFDTVHIGGTDGIVTAKSYALLLAFDRSVFIDEVVLWAEDTGTATVSAVLKRSASGTAMASGTAISDSLTVSGVADATNAAFVLIEASATLTDPRVVRQGEVLSVDFTAVAGAPNDVLIYIRWRTSPE